MAHTEYNLPNQSNLSNVNTFYMGRPTPIVAERIWDTLAHAQGYVQDTAGSAFAGMRISVTSDSTTSNNGLYYVQGSNGSGGYGSSRPFTLIRLAEGIGSQGVQGVQGKTGSQGATGTQGPEGTQGPKGNDGTSVSIKPDAALCTTIGDAYIGNDGVLYVLTYYNEQTGEKTFQPAGQIKGPQGNDGPQGATGAQGATGMLGYSITASKAYLSQASNDQQWNTWMTVGSSLSWTNSASDRGDTRIGDYFIIIGISTEGNTHLGIYLSNTGTGNLQGVCKTHTVIPKGAQGASGTNGTQGAQGARGASGQNGTQGAQGTQGIQGVLGYSITASIMYINGEYDDGLMLQWLEMAHNIGAEWPNSAAYRGNTRIGDYFVTVVRTVEQNTYLCISSSTTNSGNLQGICEVYSIIPKGIQGSQGTTGSQGATGTQGPEGTQGSKGNDGTSVSIKPDAASCTTIGDAYIGNDGVLYVLTYYNEQTGEKTFQPAGQIKGPQGNDGPQGATGAQGTTGSQGSTGTQGNTGAQGVQGVRGMQGVQGPAGSGGSGGNSVGMQAYSSDDGDSESVLTATCYVMSNIFRSPLSNDVTYFLNNGTTLNQRPFAVGPFLLLYASYLYEMNLDCGRLIFETVSFGDYLYLTCNALEESYDTEYDENCTDSKVLTHNGVNLITFNWSNYRDGLPDGYNDYVTTYAVQSGTYSVDTRNATVDVTNVIGGGGNDDIYHKYVFTFSNIVINTNEYEGVGLYNNFKDNVIDYITNDRIIEGRDNLIAILSDDNTNQIFRRMTVTLEHRSAPIADLGYGIYDPSA